MSLFAVYSGYKDLNKEKWKRFGYFIYTAWLIPIFLLLKLILVFRSGGFKSFTHVWLLNLLSPSESYSTEIQSLFTTASRFSIDSIRSGFHEIFDPAMHFFSSFMGASIADFPRDVVQNGLFTLGGSLPVSSFASLPPIIVPPLMLISVAFLKLLIRFFTSWGFNPAVSYFIIEASTPRALFYKFNFLYRSLLIALALLIAFKSFIKSQGCERINRWNNLS